MNTHLKKAGVAKLLSDNKLCLLRGDSCEGKATGGGLGRGAALGLGRQGEGREAEIGSKCAELWTQAALSLQLMVGTQAFV